MGAGGVGDRRGGVEEAVLDEPVLVVSMFEF
jgi:hypothetical protein